MSPKPKGAKTHPAASPDLLPLFQQYLSLERGYADHTIEAYLYDLRSLIQFLESQEGLMRDGGKLDWTLVTKAHIRRFMQFVAGLELAVNTQARMLSGIKAFFRFLVLEARIQQDPCAALEAPKIPRNLPEVLSLAEIESLISAIDLSRPEGIRNRAMVEVLYSAGLRVSELIELRLSQLYLDLGYLRVRGKGDRERLVPIGSMATHTLETYLKDRRPFGKIQAGAEDYVFLNRRGKPLSRVMVFLIVRDLAQSLGLKKKVYPHIFRHSFATHLVESGADLRAVQQMLGHQSITTTEIYTHLDRDYLRATLERFHPRFKSEEAKGADSEGAST